MNDKPTPLNGGFLVGKIYSGFGMKSALTERASEPWLKGVHPKEAAVGEWRGATVILAASREEYGTCLVNARVV